MVADPGGRRNRILAFAAVALVLLGVIGVYFLFVAPVSHRAAITGNADFGLASDPGCNDVAVSSATLPGGVNSLLCLDLVNLTNLKVNVVTLTSESGGLVFCTQGGAGYVCGPSSVTLCNNILVTCTMQSGSGQPMYADAGHAEVGSNYLIRVTVGYSGGGNSSISIQLGGTSA